MDRKGIDISVLSVTPVVFFYWLDADKGLDAARVLNDGIAAMVASRPTHFRGMATLPMQDVDAAVAELERATREHGFRAVELGCRIKGDLVSDAKFRPVLKRAAELKVAVFAHPYIAGALPKDLCNYYLGNTHGLPFDTALMASHLMLDGTLDALPDLDFILAHGGGHLPYQFGRLDHRVGADRVMIGTDAPFDMAEDDPLGMLAQVDDLTDAQRERILSLNALEVLGEKP